MANKQIKPLTLRGLRNKKGLTLGDVSDKLGISRQAISRWETGKSSPSVAHLVALSDIYGVSMDVLVEALKGSMHIPHDPT